MKIVVIGGGISGLVAAYKLQQRHQVVLLESESYLGGHTRTVEVHEGQSVLSIDTGFIVYNDRTYPNFTQLLKELHVSTMPTTMSLSVSCERTGLEYCGTGFNGLFAQRRNVCNPKIYRLLYDFVRFKRLAAPLLSADRDHQTVGQFLSRHRFSTTFTEQYFLPMGSAIWSCPHGTFLEFPIEFIVEFYHNHGLLGVTGRPTWRVVCGGSQVYVRQLRQRLQAEIQTGVTATGIQRRPEGVTVHLANSNTIDCDHLVMACHSDQALRILGPTATPTEKEMLSAFPYQPNRAVLHTQIDRLPTQRRAWAAWNYRNHRDRSDRATVTYNMNILQSLKSQKTYCVTLNDSGTIRDENIIGEFNYSHPTFDIRRRAMQQRHTELIDHQRVSYCGAYWGNGFHEDGVCSGQAVARRLNQLAPRSEADHA